MTPPKPTRASKGDRDAFWHFWQKHKGRTCWGLWQHARTTRLDRAKTAMKTNRKNRYWSKLGIPPKIPFMIRRRFYAFRHDMGRCNFPEWYAWHSNKGPHPLRNLGG